MDELPETSESLLIRVRDPNDREAWDRFVSIYRPVVYRLARGRGLQDADAHDLAQKVLASVAKAIPEWRPTDSKTRFRTWLLTIAKNATINELARKPRDLAAGGTTATRLMREVPQAPRIEDAVDVEYRRQLYRQAAKEIEQRADPATWRAFAMTMVEGMSIADAAQQLDCSVGVVYAARSRIMKRIRQRVEQLREE